MVLANRPTFNNSIVDRVRKTTEDSDILSLFERVDGYIEYKYHLQKGLKEKNTKKAANEMTDEARENPSLRNHSTDNKGIKNTQPVAKSRVSPLIINPAIAVAPGFDPVISHSTKYTYHDHGLEWDNSGKNAFYSKFSYTP